MRYNAYKNGLSHQIDYIIKGKNKTINKPFRRRKNYVMVSRLQTKNN
jgi:hypothetical protein